MQEPIYDRTNQSVNALVCFMDFPAWKIQGMNDREIMNCNHDALGIIQYRYATELRR